MEENDSDYLNGIADLQQKHEHFAVESLRLTNLRLYTDAMQCDAELKKIEKVAFELLKKLQIDEKHTLFCHYMNFLRYFGFNYEEQYNALELHLTSQKRKLKLASKSFDFKLANRMHDEIRATHFKLKKVLKIIQSS